MGSKPFGISASRGSAFLGVNPYKSPVEAFVEIMEERIPGFCAAHGYVAPVKKDPFADPLDPKQASLRWGTAFESGICSIAGVFVDRERVYTGEGDLDFLSCHIDGRDTFAMLNENKTVFSMAYKSGWGAPGTDLVPAYHQVQAQHQMKLTKDTRAILNALIFPIAPAEWEKAGFTVTPAGFIYRNGKAVDTATSWAQNLFNMGFFAKYELTANERAQKEMTDRYRFIWENYILKETPPPATVADDIKWLFALPEGEIEASDEIRELWQETIDIDTEIDSMISRKDEIKTTFAIYACNSLSEKTILPGNEPRKLNIMAGQRKLFTVSRPEPGAKVSRSSTERIAEENPALYEEMKKTTFAEILGDIDLTDNQAETVAEIDGEIDAFISGKGEEIEKFLSKKKLSAILSRESIIKAIERAKPELYKKLVECSIIELTEPAARLTIKKPEGE
jgi:hypothetical protein